MYKVLLVDDEPLILEGLSEYILWEEYELEISGKCNDGQEAIDFLKDQYVHIVITDIRMPGTNGMDLLKYIKLNFPTIKVIVLSGYSDFEYVKEAAKLGIENYLLKPVDEAELIPTIINTVQKIESEAQEKIETRQGISIIRENILLRWVCGDIDKRELLQRASLLEIDIQSNEYVIAIVHILDDLLEINAYTESDKRLLRFAVHNICQQIVNEQQIGISFFDLNGDIIILFTGLDFESKRVELEQILSTCIQNINTWLKLNVFITVGHPQKHYLSLNRSYLGAKAIQELNQILHKNTIIFSNDLDESSEKRRLNWALDFENLNKAIQQRDREAVKECIHHISIALQAHSPLNPANLQDLALEILMNIIAVIKSGDTPNHSAFNSLKKLWAEYHQFKTIQELESGLIRILDHYFETLLFEENKMNPIIKNIITFTQAHYAEDINLKTVANAFGLNASYLGHLFTKEMDINFNQYLNSIRIAKAKELLRNTNNKANQVARMVGYVNTNYFSTLFKKMTGITPTEY